jgi:hypothetical protein
MKDITLTLSVDHINAILQTLGQLPTSSGAFPLLIEIKRQADAQLQESETNETIPQVKL